jgi:hypothetical protein
MLNRFQNYRIRQVYVEVSKTVVEGAHVALLPLFLYAVSFVHVSKGALGKGTLVQSRGYCIR